MRRLLCAGLFVAIQGLLAGCGCSAELVSPTPTPTPTQESQTEPRRCEGDNGKPKDIDGDCYADLLVADFYGMTAPYVIRNARTGSGATKELVEMPEGWEPNRDYVNSAEIIPDINGDGLSDAVLVISLGNDTTACVRLGSREGLGSTCYQTIENPSPGNSFGDYQEVGDIDQDGRVDLVLSSPNSHANGFLSGAVYFFRGEAEGFSSTPTQTFFSPGASPNGDNFGSKIVVSDLNGDSFSDLAVAAQSVENEKYRFGKVFVYQGSGAGLSATPSYELGPDLGPYEYPGGWAPGYFGTTLAAVGDSDGDGFNDLVIGERDLNSIGSLLHIHRGSPGGPTALPAQSILALPAENSWLSGIAALADQNGDGLPELVAAFDDTNETLGEYQIFASSVSGYATTPIFTGNLAAGAYHVVSAGDIDNDGHADLLLSLQEDELMQVVIQFGGRLDALSPIPIR